MFSYTVTGCFHPSLLLQSLAISNFKSKYKQIHKQVKAFPYVGLYAQAYAQISCVGKQQCSLQTVTVMKPSFHCDEELYCEEMCFFSNCPCASLVEILRR